MTPPTIWFLIDDLLDFARGRLRPSGIQRLTFEVYRAAQRSQPDRVRFVRRDGAFGLLPVDWTAIEAAFASRAGETAVQAASAPTPVGPAPGDRSTGERSSGSLRRAGRQLLSHLPERVRRPLVLSTVMQVQVAVALGRAGLQAGLWSARSARSAIRRRIPARPRPVLDAPAMPTDESDPFEVMARAGDVVLVLGSPWSHERYDATFRWLRDDRRIRTGIMVHDTIPVRRPEWCAAGVIRTYGTWHEAVLPVCDLVIANSRATAADVASYAASRGIVLPGEVAVLPVGSGFGLSAAEAPPPGLPEPGRYALFVATIEARKNHLLLFRLWRRLLDERGPAAVPDLVFAGREGWLVADLMQQLENTRWLDGKIRLVRDPSDAALQALYAGSLFTLFPSLYEGWGLPVTESLAFGKPCLCSNTTSLPEAGGTLARYFDPESLPSLHAAVVAVLDDPAGLAAWEAQVRREFRPVSWDVSAAAVLAMADALG